MAKHWIYGLATALMIIGALNWGLALWNVNIVTSLFGSAGVAKLIYALIGLSGLVGLYTAVKK